MATLTTESSNQTSYEIGGTAPTDTAHINVSGAGGSPPAPTGTVSFYLCGPSTTAITSCTPAANQAAFDTKGLANVVPVGTVYSVTSAAPTITSAGYYCSRRDGRVTPTTTPARSVTTARTSASR